MLTDIETFHLFFRSHAKSDCFADRVEQYQSETERPDKSRSGTQGLHTQLFQAVAVEQAALHIEQARCQRAPETTNAVNTYDIIVFFSFFCLF